jgi:integrase
MRTASDILGHSSTSLTSDTYAHVMPEAKARPQRGP